MKKMKNLMLIALVTSLGLLSFKAEGKVIKINTTLTSGDGCEWHITGTVNASGAWGWPPIKIDSYNVTATGPCGTHNFVGSAGPSGGRGNNGEHTPNVNSFRYRSKKMTPKTTPWDKRDKEMVHKAIVQYAIKNYEENDGSGNDSDSDGF